MAILAPAVAGAIRPVLVTHTVGHVSTRERDAQAILTELAAVAQMPADVLLLDVDAGPAEPLLQGLRQYRTSRPQVRVIALAPSRKPGDQLVSALVSLGVYDVLAPGAPGELGREIEKALSGLPATYAEAARWHGAPALRPEQRRESSRAQERWRVLRTGKRSQLLSIATTSAAADATDLAWHLAQHLAGQGVLTALLLDLPAAKVAEVESELLPLGLPLVLHSHDDTGEAATSGRADRLRIALQPGHPADVVVVDLGHIESAVREETMLLAASDHLVLCWPESPIRLQDAVRWVTENRHQVAGILTKAVHCLYRAPGGQSKALTRLLRELLSDVEQGSELPVAVGVPMGPKSPDLMPLLDALAPARLPKEAEAGYVWPGASLRLHRGLWVLVAKAQHVAVLLAVVSLSVWMLMAILVLSGLDMPDWTLADILAGFLRRVLTWIRT